MTRGEIFRLFYELRQQYDGTPPPARFSKGSATAIDGYIAWCAKHKLSAEGFMRWRFEAAKVTGYKIDIYRLRSDVHRKMWNEWGGGKIAKARREKRIAETIDPSKRRQLELATALLVQHEQFRRNMLADGKAALCMDSQEFSGGFHPHSRFCSACPEATRCGVKLNEKYGGDMVSLRLAKPANALPTQRANGVNRV